MENFISSRHNIVTVPESYVLPPERRPGRQLVAPPCKTIPVIDLQGLDRNELIRQISKASQEYGFFQLINHGVSEELMNDTLVVAKEFNSSTCLQRTWQGSLLSMSKYLFRFVG